MTAPGWKREGSGYRQIDPARDAWIAARMCGMETAYILACCLYYAPPLPDLHSPWSDAEFDRYQTVLEHSPETSAAFRARVGGNMKTGAHALKYTAAEIEAAIRWSTGVDECPLASVPEIGEFYFLYS